MWLICWNKKDLFIGNTIWLFKLCLSVYHCSFHILRMDGAITGNVPWSEALTLHTRKDCVSKGSTLHQKQELMEAISNIYRTEQHSKSQIRPRKKGPFFLFDGTVSTITLRDQGQNAVWNTLLALCLGKWTGNSFVQLICGLPSHTRPAVALLMTSGVHLL